jgi:choline dehydrogenase
VADPRFTHELTAAFLEAAAEYGIAANDDANGAVQDGAGLFQVTHRRGERWSAADAYLRPASALPGVRIETGALATRVVVKGGRATGVEYVSAGRRLLARATGDVLVCGGAVNSPQLLMLSGVGPADHLREVGVDLVADVPGVGGNLQDHLAAGAIWLTQGTTSLHDHETVGALLRWRALRSGPLASTIAEAYAFVRSRDGLPAPDLQLHVAPVAFANHGLSEPPGPGFTVAPVLVSVASRGRIRLRSADPTWRPAIDAGYLTADGDLDALVAGTRLAREVARLGPLPRFLREEYLPGESARTDADLRAAVRRYSQTLYHPVGTCAMGVGAGAVVDTECRVHGVDGLRVVDASVMPAVPRGNTNAPTIAIAEKAADQVLGRPPLPPYDPAWAADPPRS